MASEQTIAPKPVDLRQVLIWLSEGQPLHVIADRHGMVFSALATELRALAATLGKPEPQRQPVSHEAARGLLDDLIAGRGGVVNRELLARYIDEQERR